MKKFIPSHHRSLIGLGLVAALGASAFAMAQPAPPPSDVPAARMVEDRIALREEHRAMRAERRAARIAGREARFEGRLAFMRTRIGITDAQAPLWDALAENLRNNMSERVGTRSEARDPDAGPPTALERLEREQERLAARVDHLDATASALAPLYNALDAEQKEIADRMLRHIENGRFTMGRDDRHGGPHGHRRGGMRRGAAIDEGFEQPLQQL
jgi:hypothetical protein